MPTCLPQTVADTVLLPANLTSLTGERGHGIGPNAPCGVLFAATLQNLCLIKGADFPGHAAPD
jgi:hypothetical protein